jgi:hypothetical protein
MKEYNRRKWWIDSDIIREIRVDADNIRAALEKYREIVQERDYISISNRAIKYPNAMYQDTPSGDAVQVGYVITAKSDFDNNGRGWVEQYIDLWVSVHVISNPFEMEAETV